MASDTLRSSRANAPTRRTSLGTQDEYQPREIPPPWNKESSARTVIRWSVPIYRRADINEDGKVDAADQGMLFADWSTDAWRSDHNDDGVVNGADLGRLQEEWNP